MASNGGLWSPIRLKIGGYTVGNILSGIQSVLKVFEKFFEISIFFRFLAPHLAYFSDIFGNFEGYIHGHAHKTIWKH